MECDKTSCPFNMDSECTNPSCPTIEECDLYPKFESAISNLPAPLYVKFTYKDEWRHIPLNEVYPVWTEFDLIMSAQVFKARHGSDGELMAFKSTDGIEWTISD